MSPMNEVTATSDQDRLAQAAAAPRADNRDGARRSARAATVGLVVTAAVIVWGLARLLGIDVMSPQMGDNAPATISVGHVLAAGVVSSLAGWALLAGLERLLPARAWTIWAVAAGVVFVLSLGAPLTGEGIATANRVVLVLLHVVVAAVLAHGLRRSR